jgi:hypothetical protein
VKLAYKVKLVYKEILGLLEDLKEILGFKVKLGLKEIQVLPLPM